MLDRSCTPDRRQVGAEKRRSAEQRNIGWDVAVGIDPRHWRTDHDSAKGSLCWDRCREAAKRSGDRRRWEAWRNSLSGRVRRSTGEHEAAGQAAGHEIRAAVFCYEAGPTGYGLHRLITEFGHSCVVVAPSLIPRKPGDRIKTNRRNTTGPARLLRAGELTPVWVPDPGHEAMRNLIRSRTATVETIRSAPFSSGTTGYFFARSNGVRVIAVGFRSSRSSIPPIRSSYKNTLRRSAWPKSGSTVLRRPWRNFCRTGTWHGRRGSPGIARD
jgi:hypothetical protein